MLIGEHPLVERLRVLVSKVAAADTTVLVTGESGTGKEVVARAIHAVSRRAARPLIAVNCSAVPDGLLESELFGHERGAFTGALNARAGVFQLANGGTIFLDEIAETSPSLQVKLLRVLQEREVRPLGSDRTVGIDVRVIATTNVDLARQVERGTFRQDLYYRLQVIPIAVPPLRARASDVAVLVEHFLARFNTKYGRAAVRIDGDAMERLARYPWPGNVRELENMIERLVVLASAPIIRVEDLPLGLTTEARRPDPRYELPQEGIDLVAVIEAFERRLIEIALERVKGNKQAAARLLGIRRTTLTSKLVRGAQPGRLASVPLPVHASMIR